MAIMNYSLGWQVCTERYTANMAITECDVLINIGARFDDRLTGNLEAFAPNAKVIHIDIDPAEIGKNVPTEIPIVADAKEALKELLNQQFESPETEDWLTYLKENAKRISRSGITKTTM